MNQHTPIIRTLLLSGAMILLALHPCFASGDITGAFTGKVVCQAGIKKAEFKDSHTLSLSYSTSATIKRRIQALEWPSSGDTLGFTERENEKVSLQHALKLLRKLSCDTEETPPPAVTNEPEGAASGHKGSGVGPGTGPGLNPNPD